MQVNFDKVDHEDLKGFGLFGFEAESTIQGL